MDFSGLRGLKMERDRVDAGNSFRFLISFNLVFNFNASSNG